MSSRVTGAGFALIAVALLAVSLLTPAVLPAQLSLFAGHPTVAEHTRTTQDVYVGLYSAQLCNSGGDGTCKSGDATGGFRAFGYAELGLTGGLAAGALVLGLLTLRRSERRKSAAWIVWATGGLAIAGAAALVIVGPFHGASAPVGLGMALHGAGILGAMIGGAIAIRPPPPIRLRVAERGSQPLSALPAGPPYNRRALRGDGGSWPGEPGHDPRPPSPSVPRSPPHHDLHHDPQHDPHHDPHRDRPFAAGPQLRPLYDANPAHGGTGGFLPVERPPIAAGPSPMARSASPMTIPSPVPLAADEPTAAGPPLADGPRPAPPFAAAEPPRPALPFADPPRPPPFGDASRAMPPLFTPDELRSLAGDPRPGMPPFPLDELRPDLRPTVSRPAADEPRPAPPLPPPLPPGARPKLPTAPPPLPGSVTAAAALPATASSPVHKPRTQVSLVPPMPDNDLPIAPPTAQITADGSPEPSAPSSHTEFPRPETPLAPPPPPIAAPLPIAAPPPVRRDVPPPRPQRDTSSPRPALRAAVPMPARSTPNPTRPPLPAATRSAPPRPTIAIAVPPIPAIPTVPSIPPPRRADTDVTDPDGRPEPDAEGATVSRVPIEVSDYVSQTTVSAGAPSPEESDAAADIAGRGAVPDTSPSGEPVSPFHAGPADPSGAIAIAARPTIQTPAQGPPRGADQPTIIAPPISPLPPLAAAAPSAPAVRDRPMPKLPISTAPDSLPPPRDNKSSIGPSPACPQCEAPMAWVEEHLRFYCKSCRMYF
jgi:hypothetical protein